MEGSLTIKEKDKVSKGYLDENDENLAANSGSKTKKTEALPQFPTVPKESTEQPIQNGQPVD